MARQKEVNFFNDSRVARMITDICNASEKSQAEIAAEMGFEKPNVITMMKQGRIKMPLARIAPFCKATESDGMKLLSAALEENYPEVLDAIAQINSVALSEGEADILAEIRKAKKIIEKETGKRHKWKKDAKSKERFIKQVMTQLQPLGV